MIKFTASISGVTWYMVSKRLLLNPSSLGNMQVWYVILLAISCFIRGA